MHRLSFADAIGITDRLVVNPVVGQEPFRLKWSHATARRIVQIVRGKQRLVALPDFGESLQVPFLWKDRAAVLNRRPPKHGKITLSIGRNLLHLAANQPPLEEVGN